MNPTLNGICPYFTMFPLEFPLGVLQRHAVSKDIVLDPFAGRGTTIFAARQLGMPAYGIDSNPVAAAISEAKLVNTTPGRVLAAARRILDDNPKPSDIPTGDFWVLAFAPEVLHSLCRLREGLLEDCESPTRKALRALILGALHGPRPKTKHSYFSNQCPRTYAPKPRYSVEFWRARKLRPPAVDVLALIKERAHHFFAEVEGQHIAHPVGEVACGDSTDSASFTHVRGRVSWVITSPPYYGMRTYLPDQWLRLWFLGGPDTVDYTNAGQVPHRSQADFAQALHNVWRNCSRVAAPTAKLVIRFGAINDRKADPVAILKESLRETPWRVLTRKDAGTACAGKRQSIHFVPSNAAALVEHDVWAEHSP